MNAPESDSSKTPVLLLKTKSFPTDHYEDLFGRPGSRFDPSFLPVLEHHFKDDVVTWLKTTILDGGFACRSENHHEDPKGEASKYGGLIFTSQRAVEAFASVVQSIGREHVDALLPEELPLYVVGPATAKGLRSLGLRCPVIGEETGNGEALAKFMLQHYNELPETSTAPHGSKLPLLFLVGEVRRDIIPKTLGSPDLQEAQRIGVEEQIVYETGEMKSFHQDLSKTITENARLGVKDQWVVVFSPQGCEAMLRCLGWLHPSTGRYDPQLEQSKASTTRVATIGPTTRNYLIEEFGFEPHVSAGKPSAEGILSAIESYESSS